MTGLLERLTVPSGLAGVAVGKIDFALGTAPKAVHPGTGPTDPLPERPLVIQMYTTVESEGFADVFTPGVHRTAWVPYRKDFDQYLPQLTDESPAKEAGCIGWYYCTEFNGVEALVWHSGLHVSTDGPSIPLMQATAQVATETGCDGYIPAGTAGGVGSGEVLGDIIFADAVKANFAGSQWEHEPWAQELIKATLGWAGYGQPDTGRVGEWFSRLVPSFIADHLKIPADVTPPGYSPRLPQAIWDKGVETVPDFAFADTDDQFGIVKNYPDAGCEEMDDFAVVYALSRLERPPAFMSIRNVSDPQMGTGPIPVQKKQAEQIYASQTSYWTSVINAGAVWGVAQDWTND